MSTRILIGDCVSRMKELPDNSVDSVVCDPPYHLTAIGRTLQLKHNAMAKDGVARRNNVGFMGQEWDGGDVAFQPETWAEVLRVLKPGGFLLAFGGDRTFHRLAVAIEDAGFDYRGTVAYLYGSGFPKSRNVSADLAKLPPCRCAVGAEVLSEVGVGIGAVSPLGLGGAGIGTECGSVDLAGLPAGTDGLGLEASAKTQRRKSAVQGGVESAVGHLDPVVFGSLDVAGVAEGEQVAGDVGAGEVQPKALRDKVVDDQTLGCSAVRAPSVAGDNLGAEGLPLDALVPPLFATPSGIGGTDHSAPVVSGHASTGTISARSPALEIVGSEVAGAGLANEHRHGEQTSTNGGNLQCETCGGVVAENIPDGLGSALKPALELIAMARKPLSEKSIAANVLKWGTGAINVDGCRIEAAGRPQIIPNHRPGFADVGVSGGSRSEGTTDVGRWPANLVTDGSDEVVAGFPEAENGFRPNQSDAVAKAGSVLPVGLNEQGSKPYNDSGSAARFFMTAKYSEEELLFDRAKAMFSSWNQELASTVESSSSLSNQAVAFVVSGAVTWAAHEVSARNLIGCFQGLSTSATPTELRTLCESAIAAILISASECLPEWQLTKPTPFGSHVQCAVVNERTGTITITISRWKSNGCAEPVTFNITPTNSEHGEAGLASARRFHYTAKASSEERGAFNNHPTVKPIALMRWLVRLVTPKGGTVLDPFMGSGSTLIAADAEQFNAIGCELSPKYAAIAERRIRDAAGMFADVQIVSEPKSEAA